MATGIGEALVAARRQQGVALSDAAAETRVRESYLAALEEEDFGALGGDVYVKGFLRSYARFLRLDPEPLIAAYRTNCERHHDDMTGLAQQPVSSLPAERSPALIVGIGVGIIAIVVLALIGLLNDRGEPQSQTLAPEPVPTGTQAGVSEGAVAGPAPETAPPLNDDPTEALAAGALKMVLTVKGGPSWLRVVVDGETQLEGEQPDGTRLTYRGGASIQIRVGDPGVVNLRVNGRRVGRFGQAGVPITKTFTVDSGA